MMQECKENLERLLRQAASMVSTSVKDSELPGGNSHGSSIVLLNSGDSFAEIFVRLTVLLFCHKYHLRR